MKVENYNHAAAAAFVAGDFARLERLRKEMGDLTYIKALGERVIDGLILLYEGADTEVKGLGLEYLRRTFGTLNNRQFQDYLIAAAWGIRHQLVLDGIPLGDELAVVERLDSRYMLMGINFAKDMIARMADESNDDGIALNLALSTADLLAADPEVSIFARGLYQAIRDRAVLTAMR